MEKESKIYIAGHRGLAGNSIFRNLKNKGYSNLLTANHSELDLLQQDNVLTFMAKEKPEYVILAAAKVGGIVANNKYRAQFIYENLMIQNNIIHSSYLNGVKKLLFLGSSCIYPKICSQPIREDCLLTGELEYTNEAYAIAKIAGLKMCESYNIQYNTNFITVMPTNLYGNNDNFDLETSHVLPALIRKFHLGKCLWSNDIDALRKDLSLRPIRNINGNDSIDDIIKILGYYGVYSDKIEIWGSGQPRRDFLHTDDLADACVFIMKNINFSDLCQKKSPIRNTHINIGSGKDISIYDLAVLIKKNVGYLGEIFWNIKKPDGTLLKLIDTSYLNSLGWNYKIDLNFGIETVYKNYIL